MSGSLPPLPHTLSFCSVKVKVKSKGVPLQAEVAQGVPGRLRPRIFLMFRHYKGGRSSAKSTSRLYPRINPWYSLSEAESTSGHMVLSGVPWKKSPVTPPGIDPGTIRLVVQRLNHYATPGPIVLKCFINFAIHSPLKVPSLSTELEQHTRGTLLKWNKVY